MKIQNPTSEDLNALDKLATGVFMENTPDESMAKWFRVLLGEDNLKHINCIFKEEKPVTAVNWYSSNIKSEDAVITVGSIGAVCCHENERGKGYADTLLKHSFGQMQNEGIAICLISGRMGIYFKNNAFVTGKEYKFSFFEKEKSDRVCHAEGNETYKYADLVYRIHSMKENRFIRSFEHTEKILKGFGSSHHGCVCELFYTDSAYVVVEINKKNADEVEEFYVIEYGGEGVKEILKHICYITGKKLMGKIEYFDKAMLKQTEDKEECNLNGTVKIINPELLFKQLKFTFQRAGIKDISIKQTEDKYIISADGENYFFDFEELHSLVFEGKNAHGILKNAFPIHMPLIDSLDFI